MSEKPTIVEALEGFLESKLRDLHVALPGRVESYNRALQAADVQPLIKQGHTGEDGTRALDSLPVVPRVPVVFSGMTYDLEKGDTVLMIFSHSSIDKWLSNGSLVDPLDDRHHDLSDAIAIPFLRSFNNATDQVSSGAKVIPGDDIRLGSKDAADPIALASELAALKSAVASWLPVANDGGASLKAVFSAWSAPGATKASAE